MKRPSALTPADIEARKQKHKRQSNAFDDEESNPEFDEDGNPLTIGAAQELYHGDSNPLYFPNANYNSQKHATEQLKKGKQRISELLKQSKFQQLNHFGSQMSKAVDHDYKIANMPQIRLIQRPMRDRNNLRSLPLKTAKDEFIPMHKR